MNEAWSAVIVAVISAISGLCIAVVQKFRKENREDHATVMESINSLHEDVRDVSKKIDGHISWHLDDKKKSR